MISPCSLKVARDSLWMSIGSSSQGRACSGSTHALSQPVPFCNNLVQDLVILVVVLTLVVVHTSIYWMIVVLHSSGIHELWIIQIKPVLWHLHVIKLWLALLKFYMRITTIRGFRPLSGGLRLCPSFLFSRLYVSFRSWVNRFLCKYFAKIWKCIYEIFANILFPYLKNSNLFF